MERGGAPLPSMMMVDAPAPTAPPVPAGVQDSEERVWISRALAGDQTAFAALVERYQGAVYNLCYRMLGSPGEAEDAAQDVFLRAWTQLHTFQQDRRFSTWLLAIASHWCIDLLRRRRQTFVPLDGVTVWAAATDPEPEESALDQEQRDAVRALLNTLPPKYRLVTVLRYFKDLSYLEIAEVTGLSESAVKTQLHRARKMLADQLRKKGAPANVLPSIS